MLRWPTSIQLKNEHLWTMLRSPTSIQLENNYFCTMLRWPTSIQLENNYLCTMYDVHGLILHHVYHVLLEKFEEAQGVIRSNVQCTLCLIQSTFSIHGSLWTMTWTSYIKIFISLYMHTGGLKLIYFYDALRKKINKILAMYLLLLEWHYIYSYWSDIILTPIGVTLYLLLYLVLMEWH
jgi:hypothetical protein